MHIQNKLQRPNLRLRLQHLVSCLLPSSVVEETTDLKPSPCVETPGPEFKVIRREVTATLQSSLTSCCYIVSCPKSTYYTVKGNCFHIPLQRALSVTIYVTSLFVRWVILQLCVLLIWRSSRPSYLLQIKGYIRPS